MAALVLHINREMLHHGAEIALLRDLYLWKYGAGGQRLLVPGGLQSGRPGEGGAGALVVWQDGGAAVPS